MTSRPARAEAPPEAWSGDGIATLAVECLALEVDAWPKPGLVSRIDSGSHADMDAGTFARSAEALRPYFASLAEAGRAGAGMGRLRAIGIAAEADMLAATDGINTHRGAIFGLGLLCAAAGFRALLPGGRRASPRQPSWRPAGVPRSWTVPSRCAATAPRRAATTAPEGARAEAAAGFPTLYAVGLPALRRGTPPRPRRRGGRPRPLLLRPDRRPRGHQPAASRRAGWPRLRAPGSRWFPRPRRRRRTRLARGRPAHPSRLRGAPPQPRRLGRPSRHDALRRCLRGDAVTLALLCSGQGPQHPAMFALTDVPEAAALFSHAAALLGGRDPRALVRDADDVTLHGNRVGQILCTLQTVAALAALPDLTRRRRIVAGYSVGEVGAWAVAGADRPRGGARPRSGPCRCDGCGKPARRRAALRARPVARRDRRPLPRRRRRGGHRQSRRRCRARRFGRGARPGSKRRLTAPAPSAWSGSAVAVASHTARLAEGLGRFRRRAGHDAE